MREGHAGVHGHLLLGDAMGLCAAALWAVVDGHCMGPWFSAMDYQARMHLPISLALTYPHTRAGRCTDRHTSSAVREVL